MKIIMSSYKVAKVSYTLLMSFYRENDFNILLFFIGIAIFFFYLLVILETSFLPTDFCQDYSATHFFLMGKQIYQQIQCWKYGYPAPYQFDAHPPFSLFLYVQ